MVNQQREVQATVTLQRSGSFPTSYQALWVAIRNRTQALDFSRYQRFIDRIFCNDTDLTSKAPVVAQAYLNNFLQTGDNRPLSIYGPYAYSVLKLAT